MRLRLTVVLLAVSIVCSAHAQWITHPTTGDTTQDKRVGIGGPIHTTARVRITEAQGLMATGPYYMTFGSAVSQWWGFRLDTGNHLHLDRDTDSGWAEGWVFKRDGDFGIGVEPQHLIHAVKDQNAGTLLRLSNNSTGNAAFMGLRMTQGDTLRAEIRSIGPGFSAAVGGANSMHIWNQANGPMLFATNGSEKMRISADGTVALNSAPYNARLMVQHGVDNSHGIFITHQPAFESGSPAQTDKGLVIQTQENVHTGVTNTGSVFGSHSWTHNTGAGVLSNLYGAYVETGATTTGTITNSYGLYLSSVRGANATVNTGFGAYIADVLATSDWGIYQVGASDTNYFAGNVIVGGPPTVTIPANNVLYVKGESYFDGTVTGTNIRAHYQDLAEWVPSTTDLAPGSVVILNRERNNEVMASSTAYDTGVAGVVSAQPGISLGIEGEGKEQIATTGRVRVRVDARTQPIRVGDLLVTSDLPGTAMRSEPMDINGRKFHQPGTIIGKALEPLDGGVGEILVLLSMQ